MAIPSDAASWTVQAPGYWYNSATWFGNVVPPYSGSDTFFLKYPVIFDHDLVLNAGAYLEIDSTGGLCGHNNITVNTGALIQKYGILELDTMFVPGGNVYCMGPGDAIFTRYARISNGGNFSVNGCNLSVGPWFNCHLPEFDFAAPASVIFPAVTGTALFPNPNNGRFILSWNMPATDAVFRISDIAGRCVYQKSLHGKSGTEELMIRNQPANALYFWEIISSGIRIAQGKMIIGN